MERARRSSTPKGTISGPAANGAQQVDARLLLSVLREIRRGNFSVRMPVQPDGATARVAAEINAIIELSDRNAKNLAGVARVIGAVAEGDLSETMAVELDGKPLEGQFLRTARTVNSMVRQLRSFASEVSRVAREVGTEGKLGGQASVPGAAGTWKDLTDNVNQLSATLTNQVRAIADVATAVTQGDLTRSIRVEASGEVALLKDKINEMIRNLRETTQKNTEQDWLTANLAKHTRMLQGQRDISAVSQMILSELAPLVQAQQGAFYVVEGTDSGASRLRFAAGYAYQGSQHLPEEFRIGEGLVGQCALDKKRILLSDVPPGYIKVGSGLGQADPSNIVVLPVLFEGQVRAVIELASLQQFNRTHLDFLDQLTESIGIVLNTIEANMRTEQLLAQSQILFAEAQEASRSKSAFLSMAAHELRTPLSVVIGYLSMLQDGTLKPEQASRPVEILMSKAKELNKIVNDLLMAARIEGGTVPTEVVMLDLREVILDALTRAEPRATLLKADVRSDLPSEPVFIDADREQISRVVDNLVNNALTYSTGQPWVRVALYNDPEPSVVIEDRGIGIPPQMRDRVFERFVRVDDPSLGPQPGTGLGLYIGRELAERHGGSLTLDRSEVGKGSRFMLRLPGSVGAIRRDVQLVSG